MNHEQERQPDKGNKLQFKVNWIWIGIGAVAAYFLISEHQAHLIQAAPYLLVLACPLLHLFMHGKHGDHASHHDDGSETSDRQRRDK